jgi:hypothetical protein
MNGGIARGGYASAANDDQPKKGGEKEMKINSSPKKFRKWFSTVAALKQRMTSENCHQLADEAITRASRRVPHSRRQLHRRR